MRLGFASVDNDLYYDPKCTMMFGDAKECLNKLQAALNGSRLPRRRSLTIGHPSVCDGVASALLHGDTAQTKCWRSHHACAGSQDTPKSGMPVVMASRPRAGIPTPSFCLQAHSGPL
jgi:hypothetical protein